MENIKDLTNYIGDFQVFVDDTVLCDFQGVLLGEKSNIVLHARLMKQNYQSIRETSSFSIVGKVKNVPLTLWNCSADSSEYTWGNEYVYVRFFPLEIIVGKAYKVLPKVKEISVCLKELNHMFSRSPFESFESFSEDKITLLSYNRLDDITANDKYGTVSLFLSFSCKNTTNCVEYQLNPIVEYEFREGLDFFDAIAALASVRNLLSFFANGYIPLNDIRFSEVIYTEEESSSNGCSVWFNHAEDIPSIHETFLVLSTDFEKDFSTIWNKWIVLYESAKPMVSLFYEIICNRSTRINCFLNLAQAIELYSNRFRSDYAFSLARAYGVKGEKHHTPLKFSFEDILFNYSNYLELSPESIPNLAKNLSDMRNYYTHYNKTKYKEPTYEEVFSASSFLTVVLLTIVYKEIDLPDEIVLNFKERVVFQNYSEDVKSVLNYSLRED